MDSLQNHGLHCISASIAVETNKKLQQTAQDRSRKALARRASIAYKDCLRVRARAIQRTLGDQTMRRHALRTDGIFLCAVAGLFLFAAAARGGTITFTGRPEGSLTSFREAGFNVFPDGFLEFFPSILPEGNPPPALGNYESGVYTGTHIRDTCGGLFRFVRADFSSPTYPQSAVRVEGYLGATLVYQQTLAGSGGTWESTSNILISELLIVIEKGDGSTVWVDNIVLTIVDCNGNGISDACELSAHDCNFNGIVDDCELAGNDCNANGVPDECDVTACTGDPRCADCNGNLIPDECEDCNHNGIADECDILAPARSSYSLSPNLTIPDSNPTGVSSTITVPAGGMITDVNVGLYIYHPIQGDVVVTLSHGGVTRRLINRSGLCHDPLRGYLASSFGSPDNLLVLDDSFRFTGIDCYVPIPENGIASYAGPAGPSQSLSLCGPNVDFCSRFTGVDFKGLASGGPWTLTVIDSPNGFAGLSGFLQTWRLDLESLSVDCNANAIPDECEHDLGGDWDNDQFIDLTDHSFLVKCLSGPGAAPIWGDCFGLCLTAFDLDHDGDIDLRDAGAFNVLFSP